MLSSNRDVRVFDRRLVDGRPVRCIAVDTRDFIIEALEPRQLISASGMGVGAFFDGTNLTPYALFGTVEDNGAVSGSLREGGFGGLGPSQALSVDGVQFLPEGRYVPHFRSSFLPYQFIDGAQFLNGRSYPVGWFSGLDGGYVRAEFALIAERAQGVSSSDLQGTWQYNAILVTATDAIGAWGQMSISGTTVSRTTNGPGFSLSDTISITSLTSDGTVRTSDGQHAFLTRSRSAALGIDPDLSDGQMAIGVLARTAAGRTIRQVAGGYRVGTVVTGTLAAALSGLDAALRNVYLDLATDGTYREYDLRHYDSGGRNPLATGTWTIAGDTIELNQTGRGPTWSYLVVADGVSLMPRFHRVSGTVEVVTGMATRVKAAVDAVFSISRNDGNLTSRLYELQSDDAWRSADLQALAGGPSITGRIVTWTDPKDHLVYAATAQATGGVGLYRQDVNGSWSFRSLDGPVISRNLDALIEPGGRVHLVGLAGDGDLLRYSQTGSSTIWGDYAWTSENIAAGELRANGDSMPMFVGPSVAYATAWGGLNVAGLDSDGNIWAVWWAPGAPRWFASNLTSTYGAEPVSGGLCVYLTPWNGINIGALDAQNQLVVTWWVPQFGGTWAHSNLSALAGGPPLNVDSVTSYVSAWGGLNVAGVDSRNGDVVVYWWSPARTQEGWAITSLHSVVDGDVPRVATALQGLAAADSSLNVFGLSSSQNLIRYFWEPDFGGVWQGQNLSEIAVPL